MKVLALRVFGLLAFASPLLAQTEIARAATFKNCRDSD